MVNVHVILMYMEADVSGGDPEKLFPKMIGWITLNALKIVLKYRAGQNAW